MRRTKPILILASVLAVLSGGCASARPYLAPTEEDRNRWQTENTETEKKAEMSPVGGPFGAFLYWLGSMGSVLC